LGGFGRGGGLADGTFGRRSVPFELRLRAGPPLGLLGVRRTLGGALARSLGARFDYRSTGTLLLFFLLHFSIDLFGIGHSFSCSGTLNQCNLESVQP